MVVSSKINPNFPIPGIDQSSRGFRDNFATIKEEIENIQAKNIQLIGSLMSDPIQVGSTASDIVIPVVVNLANVQAAGSNLSVQYNFNNLITGSEMYYNAGKVGINTNSPLVELDVQGNASVSGTLSIGTVPTITGSRGGNAALASLLTALAAMGLIIDGTSA